ncbi:MAG TPA: glycosyltransferase [Agriterribacter sp.]|nr:glycosyltransferase [Agriterribacter sp.]
MMKETLVKQGVPAGQIIVLPPAASSVYQFFDWEKKQSIKEKYTAGKEYFLLPIHSTSHNSIMNVLKAFSQFKKWQQSNMQLMIMGKLSNDKKIRELLQTYKYRSDVKVMEDILTDTDNAAITASAMTMIYLPASEGPAVILKEALQSGTPVITVASPAFAEVCKDAVLYSDPLDVKDLAGNMMKLYKDEKFRNQLIKKGGEQVLPGSEAAAVQTLWNCIQQELTA